MHVFRKLGMPLALIVAVIAAGCADARKPETAQAPRADYRAKNVVLMISDGCGFNHVAAASIYRHGREGATVCDSFPVKLAISTYPAGGSYDGARVWADFDYLKKGATDSAAAATALATGQKTYNGAIGVIGSAEAPVPVESVLERAEKLGKSTGVVTTVPFSHATPAAFVVHDPDRDNYRGIAKAMMFESPLEVIMGCGNPDFDRNGKPLSEPEPNDFQFVGGEEVWKQVLAGGIGGDADGDGEADPWTLIQSRSAFESLATGDTPKRILGVAEVQVTLQQKRSGDAKAPAYEAPLVENVPTLSEMTAGALNVLDNDPDGFVLMIEGGSIDTAAHSNQSGRVIEEELDFLDAVAAVCAWVEKNSNWDDTLLIVTGDHETGYLTGPGSGPPAEGAPEGTKPVWNPLGCEGAGKMPLMEWHSGSHTNSLLPLYARGRAAAALEAYADETDAVRGRYVDNTEVAKTIFEAIE